MRASEWLHEVKSMLAPFCRCQSFNEGRRKEEIPGCGLLVIGRLVQAKHGGFTIKALDVAGEMPCLEARQSRARLFCPSTSRDAHANLHLRPSVSRPSSSYTPRVSPCGVCMVCSALGQDVEGFLEQPCVIVAGAPQRPPFLAAGSRLGLLVL